MSPAQPPAAVSRPSTLRVLGCSGAIAADSRTTAFLLDDDVLIDAGSGVGDLALDALAAIDHILLSHSHLDHVLGVPLLADAVMRRRRGRPPIRVHALPETLQTLRDHLFNGQLWPDFTRLPSRAAPVLTLEPLAVGDVLELRGRRIEVLPASHSVPAVGFAVLAPRGALVYTGDTSHNPALWRRLRDLPVRHLIIETAFSDEERGVAELSGHLHPSALAEELRELTQRPSMHITHIKPGESAAVMADIQRLIPSVQATALRAGQHFTLD